jgi:CDGSH-type Zn-finger protein
MSGPVGKTPGVFKLCGRGLGQTKPFCDASHHQLPATP